MKLLTLLLLFVTAATLSAQTKQIAHRSHSGAPSTFVLSATPDNLGIGFHYEPEPDTLTVIDSAQIQKPALLPPAEPAPAIVPKKPVEPKPVKTTEPAAEPSISKKRSQAEGSEPMSQANSSKDLGTGSLTWLLLGCVLPAIAFAARGFFGGKNEES